MEASSSICPRAARGARTSPGIGDTTRASLLESLQGVIERTYDLDTGVREIGRFVIGDAGYRALYGERERAGLMLRRLDSGATPVGAARAGAAESFAPGARTLLREADAGLAVCIYYPDSLVSCLERDDPTRRLNERNVDAFAVLVEELDHFLTIAERFRRGGVMSLLELELHANVTKYFVLKLFVGRLRGARLLSPADTAWIRFHLFDKAEFREPDPAVQQRYRDAGRLAARYVEVIDRMAPAARLRELRRFHRMSHQEKLARAAAC